MTNTAIYDAAVDQAAARHGVPVAWIKMTIGAETSFQTPAPNTWEPESLEYAVGPMQILFSTARSIAPGVTLDELEEPATNIDIGTAYLARLRDRYGDDYRDVYSAYNSGSPTKWKTPGQVATNVQRALGWLAQFPAAETAGASAGLLIAIAFLILRWRKGK